VAPTDTEELNLGDAELLAQAAEAAAAEDENQPVILRPEDADRLGDLDALGTYLREIGRYPLLTAEQEVELAQRIERGVKAREKLEKLVTKVTGTPPPADNQQLFRLVRGLIDSKKLSGTNETAALKAIPVIRDGAAAQHHMVQSNLRLVVSIARRYRATGIPLLDLVQEGNIGLMRAVDKFEWRKGFKFSTYATWWIRQAIQRGIADRGRAIRLPVHVHELLVRVRRARSELEAQLGREATDEEVAKAARLPLERVRELRGLAANLLSLETPVGEAGEATLGEFVPDENATEQYNNVLKGIGSERSPSRSRRSASASGSPANASANSRRKRSRSSGIRAVRRSSGSRRNPRFSRRGAPGSAFRVPRG